MRSWATLRPNSCPACGGFGYQVAYRDEADPPPPDVVRHEARPGGAIYYLVRCPVCGRGRLSQYLRRLSQIPASALDLTLDQIRDDLPGQAEAYRAARAVYGRPAGWLTLWGPAGTGKTLLLWALMNSLRERYHLAGIYTTSGKLLDSLRQGYEDANLDTLRRLGQLESVAVLAIDELDGAKWNEWVEEKLGDLLNTRYVERPRKVTLLAANAWDPSPIPAYIRSRAADADGCRLVRTGGPDLRALPP